MNAPDPDFENEWAGLEPPPPKDYFWLWLVGFSVVGLLLVSACGLAAYVYFSPQGNQTTADPALIIPTPLRTPAPEATPELPLASTITSVPVSTAPPTPPLTSGNVSAVRLAAPPMIDGELTEWPPAAAVESAFRVYSATSWDGSADCLASWRLAWDKDHLYIAVEVADDIHVQTAAGNQIFRGDSVDIQFDTDRAADFGAGLSPDDFQITLSPGDFGGRPPAAFRFRGTASGAILDAPGGHGITLAARQTVDGYALEAAVPWTDLELTPQAGLVIGIALNANDNDTPGTAVQEVMMSHSPGRTLTDPTSWGSLTLE